MELVLLHSPLVGPSTWRWVADALTSSGHHVVVPDLRATAITGDPSALIAAAAAAVPAQWEDPVVVGHSGVGALLPSIAEHLGTAAEHHLVFVDAGVPPCDGSTTPGGDFIDRLRELAVDGMLPRWSTWWGEGTMERLVPDADRRRTLEAEIPELPLAYFEAPVEVPDGWCATPRSYVLLSEAYRGDAERARALGWRTIERLGSHLDIANDAGELAAMIIEVSRRPDVPSGGGRLP